MPVTRRSRTIAAPRAEVWETVSDPHHLPRWWPRVERVEAADSRGYTQVLRSDRSGAFVRADFRAGVRRKPELLTWTQDLAGTPFERLLRSSETRIALRDAEGGAGTEVELAISRDWKGISRFGVFLARRAARRELDGALAALAELHAPG